MKTTTSQALQMFGAKREIAQETELP